jgi:hypothetical protein
VLPWLRYDRRHRRYKREADYTLLGAAMRELAEMEHSRWGRRMRALDLKGDPMAMAQPNGAPAVHAGLLAGFGGFMPSADVQVFVPQTCAQTLPAAVAGLNLQGSWQKPKGARFSLVVMQGCGGGGGSGRLGTTITQCCGGGGGGGGAWIFGFFLAADLPDEVPVWLQAGGVGGAAISTIDTSGAGASPNSSAATGAYFGRSSYVQGAVPGPIMAVSSGVGGNGGTAANGSGGAAITNSLMFGVAGGSGGAANTGGTGGAGGATSSGGAGGGGAGGGLTSGNSHSAGGGGGGNVLNSWQFATGATGGAAGGGNGASGTNGLLVNQTQSATQYENVAAVPLPVGLLSPGSGGCGGGSAAAGDLVPGGSGGNGFWGGGGGGGGAGTDTTSASSGAGGNGGDSYIIAVSW